MKAQLDELTTKINKQVRATTSKIEEVIKGEMKRRVAGKEKWDIGVKDTLV